MPNLDNWREVLVSTLELHCTGMDDHDGAGETGLGLLERCENCRNMYSELEPLIKGLIMDAAAKERIISQKR